jgi:hypothetical protein
VQTAKETHELIKAALKADPWVSQMNYDVDLQGSYKNYTNIFRESDVDVVVQLNSAQRCNLTHIFERKGLVSPALPEWCSFMHDVYSALKRSPRVRQVTIGKKALKVVTDRRRADVVVCIRYRKYRLQGDGRFSFIEGMTFWVPQERRWVVNYPRLHSDNGAEKSKRTRERYKRTVRMFKNARTYLVEHGRIPADLAPSYFLECLLYNVPDRKFVSNLGDTFRKIIDWLLRARLSDFVCQNGQIPLFGSTPEQWSEDKARRLLKAMADLWKNWR